IESASKLDREYPFDTLKGNESTTDPIKAAELQESLDEKIEELVEKYPDIEKNLKKAITVSSIISSFQEEQDNLKGDSQKVVVIGLDNAGKTAILSQFGGRLGIGELAALPPTKGVDRKHIEMEGSDVDLFIMDLGGQYQYRSKYLKNPESYFLQTDLLIYVIDVQDSERYPESFEYFEEVLEILNMLEENPFVMVYIHKYDPDFKGDQEILLNIELLKDNLNLILTQHGFDYEAYLTSIYSLITNEPQFSRYIKDVMRSTESLTNPTLKKVEGLGKTLEETMNAVIRLSESISKQLNNLDSRLNAIESGAFQIAQSGTPISIQNPRPGNSRIQVLDELKELFQKKKKLNF
ncbi:MAG: 50S ribosome-binding GTPase, partial [Candidatus Lokiarchaeota archaeon]|nr:50S ribosome-binding GTPase [Candidatus Lokiarchaeota archaeon]